LTRISTASGHEAKAAISAILAYNDELWEELDAMRRLPGVEAEYVDVALPPDIVLHSISMLDDLGEMLVASAKLIDPRWRGDALSAARQLLSLSKGKRKKLISAHG
jgi:hypothetical protein